MILYAVNTRVIGPYVLRRVDCTLVSVFNGAQNASSRKGRRTRETRMSTIDTGEIPVVFVVDSDSAVRDSLAWLIHYAGWRPRTAASAEEFLADPQVSAPCCLLTELQLPGMSGLALQRCVLDRSEMPVVFMSACADIPAGD